VLAVLPNEKVNAQAAIVQKANAATADNLKSAIQKTLTDKLQAIKDQIETATSYDDLKAYQAEVNQIDGWAKAAGITLDAAGVQKSISDKIAVIARETIEKTLTSLYTDLANGMDFKDRNTLIITTTNMLANLPVVVEAKIARNVINDWVKAQVSAGMKKYADAQFEEAQKTAILWTSCKKVWRMRRREFSLVWIIWPIRPNL